MGEVVNLRLRRKQQKRRNKDRQAAANRIVHGRSKGERQRDQDAVAAAAAHLDGHRRDRRDGEGQ